MDFETKSRVYIQTDDQGRILRCEGEYTLPPALTDWILIEEGPPCDRLNLAQSHYFDGGLYTMDGIPRYKWDGTQTVERTEEEIEADRASMFRGYTHYIKVNENNRVIDGWSTGATPDKDPSDAVVLRTDGSYEFRLFPTGEDNPVLLTYDDIPLYAYADGEVFRLSYAGVEHERELRGGKTHKELQKENEFLKAQIQAQSNRSDFVEDCIAEMATMVYGGV